MITRLILVLSLSLLPACVAHGTQLVDTDSAQTLENKTIGASNTITLGSGVASLGGNFTISGAYATTLTVTGTTGLTLPTTGTLLTAQVGTWTPSVGGNATYTSRTGTYVKIGPLVYIHAFISISTIGTGDTGVIYGLPYLPAEDVPLTVTRSANLAISVVSLGAFANSGGQQIDLIGRTAAAASETVPIAVLGNAASITISGVYRTAQ